MEELDYTEIARVVHLQRGRDMMQLLADAMADNDLAPWAEATRLYIREHNTFH